MDKKEIRVFIKNFILMGKNTVEAKQCLDKRYGDSAPGKSTMTLNALIAQNQQLFQKP